MSSPVSADHARCSPVNRNELAHRDTRRAGGDGPPAAWCREPPERSGAVQLASFLPTRIPTAGLTHFPSGADHGLWGPLRHRRGDAGSASKFSCCTPGLSFRGLCHDLGQAPGDDLRHKVGVGAWLFRPGLSSSPTWLTLTDTPGFSYRPIAQPWLCRSAAPKPAGASHGLGIETPTPGSSIQGPLGSQSCPPSRSGEKSEHLLQS